MKIAIYSRKSKFTGKGESIEIQIELCKDYIQIHLPETKSSDIDVFEEEGISGKATKNRPQFLKMMEDKNFKPSYETWLKIKTLFF